VRFPSYSRVALLTTMNIILNAVTLGRYVLLEGRVRRGVFMNWAVTKADMAKVHQNDFAWFLDLVEWHDPDGKFANDFTRRLFGHGAQPHH
jgi:hypothetical protein